VFALPIASCGLKFDDEAVRVAVGLRLGLDLCVPHNCHCGSPVDARGLHSFVCVSLVPWQSGKTLCWDVTVTCPLAESYVDRASHQAGSAAELAATHKEDKYVDLGARYIFEPIAIETLGVFNASARQLLADLGKRIAINTGEARETSYLFQRISVLVQRFNAVLLHDSLPAADCRD